jgi:serine kinase of HPr protein (carbohydrate metabolism regulator)
VAGGGAEEDVLHLRILTGEETLKKEITNCDINRPGLALAAITIFDFDRISCSVAAVPLPKKILIKDICKA